MPKGISDLEEQSFGRAQETPDDAAPTPLGHAPADGGMESGSVERPADGTDEGAREASGM